MPEGCTEPSAFTFVVPKNYKGGDTVTVTIEFRIKRHCIQKVKRRTQLSRQGAIKLLTQSNGHGDQAVDFFIGQKLHDSETAKALGR